MRIPRARSGVQLTPEDLIAGVINYYERVAFTVTPLNGPGLRTNAVNTESFLKRSVLAPKAHIDGLQKGVIQSGETRRLLQVAQQVFGKQAQTTLKPASEHTCFCALCTQTNRKGTIQPQDDSRDKSSDRMILRLWRISAERGIGGFSCRGTFG